MALTTQQQQAILAQFVQQRGSAVPVIWDAPTIIGAISTVDSWMTNNQASVISALQASDPAFLAAEPSQAQLQADLNILFQLVLAARYTG